MAADIHFLLFSFVATNQLARSYTYECTEWCGDQAYCCGHNVCCHYRPSYSFYSVWYFWFIVALLIMACAGSCSYYRRRHRLLTVRRNIPVAVVTFSHGGRGQEHGPVDFVVPPSYQEATSKPTSYPPPYYTSDLYANSHMNPANTQVPPYPG